MITACIRYPTLVLFMTLCVTIPSFVAAQKVTGIDTTVPFSRLSVAKIKLSSGDIRVTTWDRNAVRVVTRAEAKKHTLEFDVSEHRFLLTGSSATYEVMLPVGTRLELSATSGDIVVVGNPGDVEVHTTSGDIAVSGGRQVSLKTVSGDIDMSGGQDVSLETVSGDIQVSGTTGDVKVWSISGSVRIEKATGAIEGETVSGTIVIVRADAHRMHLSSTSGSISYTGTLDPEGRYKLESHSGRVTMSLPEDVRTSIDVATLSGKVVNEFRSAVRLPAESGTAKTRYRYTIGTPRGGQVSITTFSGTVVISKRQ